MRSSRKTTNRISVFQRLSLSNTTKSSRKTRRSSVFKRLFYCTNPPANGDSKPIKSATTRRRDSTSNLMFLVRHGRNENLEYSVITIENNNNSNNSLRLLADDDEDLPHNFLSVIRVRKYNDLCRFSRYPVLGSCDSYIWVLDAQNPHPYDLLWDMSESRPVGFYPSVFPTMKLVWLSGFGFDPVSGDYKAVRCWMHDLFIPTRKVYAEVLSLRTGSWKAIPYPHNSNGRYSDRPSICVNGVHHWLVRDCRGSGAFSIISFDFSNEMFDADLICLPKEMQNFICVVLVEFHGSLAVICCNFKPKEDDCFTFEIWAWRNEGNWSLVSTFNIPAAVVPRQMLGLYKNEKLFLKDSKCNLLLYDCATRDLENLGIYDDELVAKVFPYIKSSVG